MEGGREGVGGEDPLVLLPTRGLSDMSTSWRLTRKQSNLSSSRRPSSTDECFVFDCAQP